MPAQTHPQVDSFPTDTFTKVAKLYSKLSDMYIDNSRAEREALRAKIKTIMQREGYETTRYGTYRAVHIGDNYVVKFAQSDLGRKENSAEIRNYTRICKQTVADCFSDEIVSGGKFIADIPDDGYETGGQRWLIMERVATTGNNVSLIEADKVQTTLKKAGIHISEVHPANMGTQNGRPIIFDYGGN